MVKAKKTGVFEQIVQAITGLSLLVVLVLLLIALLSGQDQLLKLYYAFVLSGATVFIPAEIGFVLLLTVFHRKLALVPAAIGLVWVAVGSYFWYGGLLVFP